MPCFYTLKGLFRPSYSVGRALQEVGIDGGATLREAIRLHSDEIACFVRQGHVHRLPQLVPYELLRWAGFRIGPTGLTRRVGEGAGESVSG